MSGTVIKKEPGRDGPRQLPSSGTHQHRNGAQREQRLPQQQQIQGGWIREREEMALIAPPTDPAGEI